MTRTRDRRAGAPAMSCDRPPEYFSTPLRFITHYLRAHRREFASLTAAVVTAAACAVAMQYQMKLLVDAMSGGHRFDREAWIALTAFAVLMGLESAMLRLSAWLACRATIAAGVNVRLDLFNYLSGQSLGYFLEHTAGSLGQRITGTAGALGALANTAAWRIAPAIIDFIGAIILFSVLDLRLAALLGAYVAASTTVLVVAGQRGRHLHQSYYAKASAVAGQLTDVISNMWAVKAFCARQREWRRLDAKFTDEARVQQASWMYTEKIRVFYEVGAWLVAAGMIAWAVKSWNKGTITPGDVVIVSTLTLRILHGARDVALALVDVRHQFGYIEDTLQTVGQTHAVLDLPEPAKVTPSYGSITLRNVSFGYDAVRPIVSDMNLTISAGEKVGIVGPSGAGKTTVLQLIQRLHEVQSGAITVDGIPIRSLKQDDLRAALSIVPQEISLFHRSIAENIRIGFPEASDAQVWEAARAARCDDMVRRLPQGLATIVGERGAKLSGGERQRVGIARALLKKAPILLLDEATSALDATLELEIQRSIASLPDRTVIAVAHRLSTLSAYDRILVIDDGRIVEQGSPAELQRHGALFRSLWRMQAPLSLVR